MIEVATAAVNWINLKGPGLGQYPTSSISLHGTRWEISLNIEGGPLLSAEARTRLGVLERLTNLLEDAGMYGVEIDREEIVRYMDRAMLGSSGEREW